MKISRDRESTEAVHRRLLAQLEQVAREGAQINLHDTRALEECRQKIAALRAQVARHLRDDGRGGR